MKKFAVLCCLSVLASLFAFAIPHFAYAEGNTGLSNYDYSLRLFYWGATVATPAYNSSSGNGYVAEFDVRSKQNSGMGAWGLGGEYSQNNNGPRFLNSGNGVTGVSFPVTGGVVQPTTFGFGGVKARYFLPTTNLNLSPALYVDYFGSTGGRTAIGAGAELGWNFANNFMFNVNADLNNVTGNGFASQSLFRYELFGGYSIPDSSLNVFLGYKGYQYARFFTTYINGALVGVGARF